MQIEENIIKALEKATDRKNIKLETPENAEFGDYSTNIALQLKVGDPREQAEKIVEKLKVDKELSNVVEKIEVAGPGFINFFLSKTVLVDELKHVLERGDKYGTGNQQDGKKIVVEYTDPNPFKEFHIGHLISNVTGESLCRILEATGVAVWRADYFGDVGVHVAKSVWGLKKKMNDDGIDINKLGERDLSERVMYMGEGYAMGTKAYDEDEIVKKEIERLNTVLYIAAQRMWEGNGKQSFIDYNPEGKIEKKEVDEVYEIYVRGRDWSLEYFEKIYKRLGTKFDGYYPESMVGEMGYKLVKDNINKVFKESEGAVIFEGEKFGLHTRVFINKHNLPTYEAKELGLAPMKYEDFKYDRSIIVVGKEIKEYFQVLVEALKQVEPKLGDVTEPIFTGMVTVPGGKMSSRFGNVITVTDLLDNLKKMVMEKVNDESYSEEERGEISEKVAVGAVKYAFLKNSIGSDIVFDMNQSLSLEGNSGPYLQYTYARTQSVLAKAQGKLNDLDVDTGSYDVNEEEMTLLRKFCHFQEVITNASKNYSPNLICNYLFDLAQKYNTFYNMHGILEQRTKNEEQSKFRIALTSATGTIIKNGLNLLGIKSPQKM